MADLPRKAEWDFFVTSLVEEARSVISETGASIQPIDLIRNNLKQIQDVVVTDQHSKQKSDQEIWTQVRSVLIIAAYRTRPYCIECGTCCQKGSPTLVKEDIRLFRDNIVTPSSVMTIRVGEMVYHNLQRTCGPATKEMIKIKEQPGETTCIFYEKASTRCSIYEWQPRQCQVQECWNPENRCECSEPLNRKDILREVRPLWEVVERHEVKCSHNKLMSAVSRLGEQGDDAVTNILDMLRFDHHVRHFIAEKLSLSPSTMDFLFGRPLPEAIAPYGLTLREEPDGSYVLVGDVRKSGGA